MNTPGNERVEALTVWGEVPLGEGEEAGGPALPATGSDAGPGLVVGALRAAPPRRRGALFAVLPSRDLIRRTRMLEFSGARGGPMFISGACRARPLAHW